MWKILSSSNSTHSGEFTTKIWREPAWVWLFAVNWWKCWDLSPKSKSNQNWIRVAVSGSRSIFSRIRLSKSVARKKFQKRYPKNSGRWRSIAPTSTKTGIRVNEKSKEARMAGKAITCHRTTSSLSIRSWLWMTICSTFLLSRNSSSRMWMPISWTLPQMERRPSNS